MKKLYYGDNLEVLRKYIKDETVDLCYIDPPFNSKRNYNQIYNRVGKEDKAQAQAFIDTWTWDDIAIRNYEQIMNNYNGLFTAQTISLISGLKSVLGEDSLFAYLVSMTLRVVEIHRVLKPTGTFWFHCDPTACNYIKILLDSIFCPKGGEFQNEIIWKRYAAHSLSSTRYDTISDMIFYYSKSNKPGYFKPQCEELSQEEIKKRFPHIEKETGRRFQHVALEQSSNENSKGEERIIDRRKVTSNIGWRWNQETFDERIKKNPYLIYWTNTGKPRYKIYVDEYGGAPVGNIWTDIKYLSSGDGERLGWDTQKPEALMDRIIKSASKDDDVILDIFCGCGTTIQVAEKLNRNWIGIDITYQSISLILKRLEENIGKTVIDNIELNGVPQDWEAAKALAEKKDDRVRKEFEKWAVLSYSNNRAIINEQKGGDKGIDGIGFIPERDEKTDVQARKIIFSVKSDKALHPSFIRDLKGTMEREGAVMGVFLCLYEPTKGMLEEAKKTGNYKSNYTQLEYPKLRIITAQDIFDGKRLDTPVFEVVKKALYKGRENTQQMVMEEFENYPEDNDQLKIDL